MILVAFLVWNVAFAQKNLLKNTPDYGIFEGNLESLAPQILVSNKVLSSEKDISEKLEIQSFQKSDEKNEINVQVDITKFINNPLNENPLASFAKITRTLDRKLSLAAMAFTVLEGDAEDDMTEKEKSRTFCEVNIDPEEGSDYRMKQGGAKMKKREFGLNLDAMFNYVNSLLKGNFHDAEAKWDFGKEYRHFYYAAAGNVYIKVEVYAHKTSPGKAPNARTIAMDILQKLPQTVKNDEPNVAKSDTSEETDDGPTSIEVYPKFNPLAEANDRGLVPASDLLPAKIVFKTKKPNAQVKFSLLVNTPGELRGGNQKGTSITATTDASGTAEAWYFYTDSREVSAPLDVQIVAEIGPRSKKAHVNVGLGLVFDKLSPVPEQMYTYSPEKPYAFVLSVKSSFYPDLNMAQYIRGTHESKIWGNKQVGFELVCNWVNKPDFAPVDEFYVGTTNISPTSEGSNTNVLTANKQPMQYYSQLPYPAVILKSEGTHIYKVEGKTVIMNGIDPEKNYIAYTKEKYAAPDALIPLSVDYPETWFKSFACCMASVGTEQNWFILEAIKLIPTYGLIADVPMTASSFVCGLLNGEYEKSVLDLASWLGGQYIDNLMEPEVFNLLTKKNQDAVLVAKTAYFGTDMYKKKGELEQIRAKQKELMK